MGNYFLKFLGKEKIIVLENWVLFEEGKYFFRFFFENFVLV